MMTGSVASLNASNAAFGWMQLANARLGLLSCCGGKPSFGSLYNADKNYELGMLNDSFQYQANTVLADSMERVKKDDIKRSFSMFA